MTMLKRWSVWPVSVMRVPVEGWLLLVAAIWGGSYTAAKVATDHLPVLEFLFLRFGLTFALLLPALKPLWRGVSRQTLVGALGLGVNLLAILLCETYGVSLTTASNAAFLISLCVAFTPLCEWALLGLRPSRSLMLAVWLSTLGAAMLAFQRGVHTGLTWGDAMMILAAMLRALMVCLTRRYSQRHALPALTLTAVQMGLMTLALGIALLWREVPLAPLPAAPVFWGAMAFMVLLCTLLAFFVQNHAVARTSASRVTLLMGSEPLFGALIAVVVLGEALTPQGWLGGLLIVVASAWVTRSSAQR
jgi:drug/metabolite transporter (DMT)-like permease